MLFQPYHSSLTAGQIREYLKAYPDHAPVRLDGGDDWADGHTLYATKPKELYMPSQDSLSRRLGPVFAEVAAKAQPRMTMEQHKAEYRSRPLGERLNGVFTETANPPEQSSAERALQRVTARLLAERTNGVSAKAYKPTHGGYPG